jgi:hypothetical protein
MPRKRSTGEGLFMRKVESFSMADAADVAAVQGRLSAYNWPGSDFRGWLRGRHQIVERWLAARPPSVRPKAGSADSFAREFLICAEQVEAESSIGNESAALYWSFQCGSVLVQWEATALSGQKIKRRLEWEKGDEIRTFRSTQTNQAKAAKWHEIVRSIVAEHTDLKWMDRAKAARIILRIWPGDAGKPPSHRSIRNFLGNELGKL